MTKEWMNWALNPDNKWSWLIIVGLAIVLTIIIKVCLKFISTRLRKITNRTKSNWDSIGVDLIDGLKPPTIFSWLLLLGIHFVHPEAKVAYKYVRIAVVFVTVFQLILWSRYIVLCWKNIIIKRKVKGDPSSAPALGLLYIAAQAMVATIFVLIGLSQLGVNIVALLAGLGVGGIAVALAAQNILGDLLASLSIVLDKPFVVGDFIVAGNEIGSVIHIGIKTTRIQSLSGEEVVVSNRDLLESRIHNYRKMYTRRIVQKFSVGYGTPENLVKEIPAWVETIVNKQEKLKFDRCHLAFFGPSSYDYELVFIVQDADYNIFMNLQQNVLFDIISKFHAEGIDFALPAQKLFVEKLPPEVSNKYSTSETDTNTPNVSV
jgi:small-conductance mechanosensitive channel